MIDDPIVEDVYQARQRSLDECDGDLAKWIKRLKAAETKHHNRVITLEKVRRKRGGHETRHPAEPSN